MVYFGVSLNAGALARDIFVNNTLSKFYSMSSIKSKPVTYDITPLVQKCTAFVRAISYIAKYSISLKSHDDLISCSKILCHLQCIISY